MFSSWGQGGRNAKINEEVNRPREFHFSFMDILVFFINFFLQGGGESGQWEQCGGNRLAEIKQISVAVCPSARPSVNNL